VLLVVGLFSLGPVVTQAINIFGPRLAKTEVRVSTVDISLVSGTAMLSDFTLGSPKGYTSPETIKVRSIYVDVDERSLLGDTLIIDRIEVLRPEIFYEKRGGTDNVKTILDAMKSGQKKSEPSSSSKAPGKRLLIKDLILREGTLNVVVPGAEGRSVRLKLSELHLKNVSKATAGAVTAEACAAVLDAIYNQVTSPGLAETLNRELKTTGAKAESVAEKMKGLLGN
jgi:uncharacterized protein involved in outer membrane biogenesis